MSKQKHNLLIIFGIIIITVIIISFFANYIIENKIEALIKDKIPAHIESTHQSISVHVLSGSVTINKPTFLIKLKDSAVVQSNIKMESLVVGGINYWDYLINDEIHIGKIKFNQLDIIHYKDRKNPKTNSTSKKTIKLPKDILINNIEINNTSVIIIENKKDATFLSFSNASIKIEYFFLNENTLLEKIPAKFKNISVTADSIYFNAGKYENLTAKHFKYEDHSILLNRIHFKTKYSEKELSQIIKTERDHINVKVEDLKIDNLNVGYSNDSLYVKSNLIIISEANAKFYRDKLVEDDLKIKKLYSKSIRELPIKLTIDSISILKSNLEYREKVYTENSAGVLYINDITAGITNISNTYNAPKKTEIIIEATFMKNTPIKANWSFDVNKTNDLFKFVGYAGKLKASDMNIFLTPLLNVKLEGEIMESNFSIIGDYNQSEINLSQDFDNIKLTILNKNKQKNKFLSSVVNMFVYDNSKKDGVVYHNVTTQVTRDKTKSFFNYLAKNIKASLLINFTHKKTQ
ncbi:MAG: hypothetical protein QM499_11955 [Flavobacteriaceae bacterium]